jgi:hypothetical protein
MGTWLHVSGPVVMVGTCGHGDQKTEKERKRERERESERESVLGQDTASNKMTAVTHFLQLNPTSHYITSSTTSWGPSLRHMSLWRTFDIQTTAFFSWPPKSHGHLIMQNVFSSCLSFHHLNTSNIVQKFKSKVSLETQGKLLAVSTCKITNKLHPSTIQ